MRNSKLRTELADRLAELAEKIRCVEHDAAERGYYCGDEPELAEGFIRNPVLERALAPTREELSRALGALQRLERREADCCIHCGQDIDAEQLETAPYAVTCSRCAQDFPLSYAGQMRIQHLSLSSMTTELLDLVDQLWSKLCNGNDAEMEICAFSVLIQDFGRELHKHFAAEEKEGYLREVLDAAPRFQRRVERLGTQHASLALQFDGIHRAVEKVAAPLDWASIQRALQDFAEDFSEHESSENEILMSAFLDDLGGG